MVMELNQAAEACARTARKAVATEEELVAAAQAFVAAAGRAEQDAVAQGLGILAQAFDGKNPKQAGVVACTCGAFVERGIDPQYFVQPLLNCLRQALLVPRHLARHTEEAEPREFGSANCIPSLDGNRIAEGLDGAWRVD